MNYYNEQGYRFSKTDFLESLQNPPTIPAFITSLQTLIHNGEYSYTNSLSLFQNVFPTVKSAKGLKHRIIKRYKNEELANELFDLLTHSRTTNHLFLQKLDDIMYKYMK